MAESYNGGNDGIRKDAGFAGFGNLDAINAGGRFSFGY